MQGYNIIENNTLTKDDNGHGTLITNIIRNNNKETNLLPIKVIERSGITTKKRLADGIHYAVDHGADILNISAGVLSTSKDLEEAVRYAYEHNVIIVAAAGNTGQENIEYPAAYSTVIAVGAATLSMDRRLETSSYGKYIDILAQGESVYTFDLLGNRKTVTGTSASAAYVTSHIATLRMLYPEIGVEEVIKKICDTAIDVGLKGWDSETGCGIYTQESRTMKNKKHIFLICSVVIFLFLSFFLIKNRYVFKEDKPFTTLTSIVQLNMGKSSVKTNETGSYVTFIAKTNNRDHFFETHFSEWNFKEQIGSGYVFEKSGAEVTIQSRQISKNYTEWSVPEEALKQN